MSDIIEATTPAADSAARADEAVSCPPVARVAALDLVRLTQGAYFIFWGLLLAVVVGAQTLIMPWVRSAAELFLGVGLLAVLVGTWRLHQAKLDDAWRASTRATLGLAALTAYFCVTFYMWRKAPFHPYLQANALGFIASGIAYLVALSTTVASLARALGRGDLAREARWFGGVTVVCLVAPFVASLIYLGVTALREDENVLLQFHELVGKVTIPALVVLLLPLALTLGMVWAAKDAVLQRLAELDQAHTP